MAQAHNMDDPYLSSDAVATFMRLADVAHETGDDNNELTTEELADFMTQVMPGSVTVTAEQNLNKIITDPNNQNNLKHFHVTFILGEFFTYLHNDQNNNFTYNSLVIGFNEQFGGGGPANPNQEGNENLDEVEEEAVEEEAVQEQQSDPRCIRQDPDAEWPAYMEQPADKSDCKNCEGVDPVSRDNILDDDVALEDLRVLPSGDCTTAESLEALRNTTGVDPTTREPLLGGKKRKSKKSRKVKKTMKKRRKTKKTKKTKKN